MDKVDQTVIQFDPNISLGFIEETIAQSLCADMYHF